MFVAMNRFRVAPGREAEFLEVWRRRDSHLAGVPGFRRFRLLRGDAGESLTLFISWSEWDSRAAFEAWTGSPEFAAAHRQARMPPGVLLGHPELEAYEVALEQP